MDKTGKSLPTEVLCIMSFQILIAKTGTDLSLRIALSIKLSPLEHGSMWYLLNLLKQLRIHSAKVGKMPQAQYLAIRTLTQSSEGIIQQFPILSTIAIRPCH